MRRRGTQSFRGWDQALEELQRGRMTRRTRSYRTLRERFFKGRSDRMRWKVASSKVLNTH